MQTFKTFLAEGQKQRIDRYMVRCPYCKSIFAIEGNAPWQRSKEDILSIVEKHAASCPNTEKRIKVRINPYRLEDASFAPYSDPKARATAAYDLLTADWRVEQVTGTYNPEIKCGAKCRSSKGPQCDCSCGGKNHGAGWA